MIDIKIIPSITTDLTKFDIKLGDEFVAQNVGLVEAAAIRHGMRRIMKSLGYDETESTDFPMGGSWSKYDKAKQE